MSELVLNCGIILILSLRNNVRSLSTNASSGTTGYRYMNYDDYMIRLHAHACGQDTRPRPDGRSGARARPGQMTFLRRRICRPGAPWGPTDRSAPIQRSDGHRSAHTRRTADVKWRAAASADRMLMCCILSRTFVNFMGVVTRSMDITGSNPCGYRGSHLVAKWSNFPDVFKIESDYGFTAVENG